MRNFINIKDISSKDLRKILNDAKKRKNKRKKLSTLDVDKDRPLKGKLLIQMYEKQSSRTRLSFHIAINQLGAGSIIVKASELHLGKGGESLADTAKILSTYGDGFMLRTDSDKKIEDFSKNLSIPIIYLLSPSSHPLELKRVSALSSRKCNLYSALEVNILYGSTTPRVIKSSIITPIYASLRFSIKGCFFRTFKTAFIPAINPCAAASS